MQERIFNLKIMKEIKERWSPRAFSDEKISDEEILSLLEAARYAPSCSNEQPWRFIVAKKDHELKKMQSILTESNQLWANKAPVLILILAKKRSGTDGKENYWHMFDTGTAWGFLTLEAQNLGLISHGMGGFDRNKTREIYQIPDDYSIIAVAAVGKYGDKEKLPDKLKEREKPGTRKSIGEILLKDFSIK